MAIARSKKDAIVDAQIDKKDIKTKGGKDLPKKVEKKKGFIASTIDELKKVEWPTWNYTVRWTSVIIVFTIAISLFLGFVDNVFTGGLKFVDCTTELTQDDDPDDNVLRGCTQDLFEDLTFRGN